MKMSSLTKKLFGREAWYASLRDDESLEKHSASLLNHRPVEQKQHLDVCQRETLWISTTAVLALCWLTTLAWAYPFYNVESYESGFGTDMQAAVHTIELEEVQFWGGIKADENGTFYMHFNPHDEVRYVGTPTRAMDEAWDRLAGNFVPLTKAEAASVRGEISEHKGSYLAATTVQHSLHCLNYLRQALYDDYYPVIHSHRPHIPDYWLHVDHCVETLRQVLQCGSDLTPVPKIWNGNAGQLLADIELVHTCRKFENVLEWTESR